ncbi:hypothetical protein [Actinomyces vulturis]|uniref:hypothetical protein n=1 Tax=Actinomyces vulturis TaxID=1857645 RepID=UPI00082CA0F2|nr:hypothetical protein [Actinomyces vulturis]
MSDAIHLANNVIFRLMLAGQNVKPMQLQRLMFLVVCRYHEKTATDLISELFVASARGPVLVTVNRAAAPFINKTIRDFLPDLDGQVLSMNEDVALSYAIEEVVKTYGKMPRKQLVEVFNTVENSWKTTEENEAIIFPSFSF